MMNGTNFGNNSARISITVGTQTCSSISIISLHTSLSCLLPSGAGTNLSLLITVATQTSTAYLYTFPPPYINTTTLIATGGDTLTITGGNFGPINSLNTVTVNGQICYMSSSSPTTLTCGSPPGTGLNRSLYIEAGGQGVIGYISYQAPSIVSASTPGDAGTIYISGANFGNNASLITAQVAGRACNNSSIVVANSGFSCSVSGIVNQGDTVVVIVDGQISSPGLYTARAPIISSMTSAPTSGGNVTIIGSGFSTDINNVNITVDGRLCTIITVVDTQIVFNIFSGAGSNLRVIVTASGISAQGSFSFLPPSISSTTVVSTLGGTIIINGTNFADNINQILITVNGQACVSLVILSNYSSVQCTAVAGVGTSIPVIIYVGLVPATGMMSYLPPIFSSASTVQTSGGAITIYGSEFGTINSALSITVNGQPCTSPQIVTPATVISCTAVPGTGVNRGLSVTVSGQRTTGAFAYQGPAVTSATAASTSGGVITIQGRNFGVSGTPISVTVGGKPCTSPASQMNYISVTCTVAAGVGMTLPVTIIVDGQSHTASVYNYSLPSITSSSSVSTVGGKVSVIGTNFGSNPANISVIVGGADTGVVIITTAHTGISFNAPAGTLNSRYTILIAGQQITGTYGYLSPTISGATSPFTNGSSMIIYGNNLGNNPSVVTVSFSSGTVQANIVTPHTAISCIAPVGSGVNKLLSVTVNTLTSGNLGWAYAPPVVLSMTSTYTTGGTVTISGYNFGQQASLMQVVVGVYLCTSIQVVVPHNMITCSLPSGIIGTNNAVTFSADSLTTKYNYVSLPPYITGNISTSTSGGAVTLYGGNFGTGANVSVYLNGRICTIMSVIDSTINCNMVRSGTSYLNGNVTVYNQTVSVNYIPYLSPIITSTTQCEPQGGVITIYGQNFGMNPSAISVTVGGYVCTGIKVVTTDTAISCTAPSYIGVASIVTIQVDGQSSPGFNLIYFTPVISVITQAPTQGGVVAITGSHFGNGTNYLSVQMNGGNCTLISATTSYITCRIGAGAGANLTAVITTFSLSQTSLFSYQAPIVYNISQIPTLGGKVSFSGSNFGTSPSSIVAYATPTVQCTNIEIVTPHSLFTCTIGPGTGIIINMTVTVSGQDTTGLFSYLLPVIQSVNSPMTQGQTVVFTGMNFGNDNSLITAYVGSQICRLPSILQNSISFNCGAGVGTGNVSTQVIVDGAASDLYYIMYEAPVITSITPADQSGGQLIIRGQNFGADITLVNITLDCMNITMVTPHTTLACFLDYDVINEVYFEVVVDGQVANYTGAIRTPPASYYVQYYGLLSLVRNINSKPSINYCLYNGVTCIDGNIISLDFSNTMLSSTLEGLCNMTSLVTIQISYTGMTGTIPSCMSTFTGIQYLNMSHNSLSGNIPAMQGLNILDLSYNQLSGPIPSSIGISPNLVSLSFICDAIQ